MARTKILLTQDVPEIGLAGEIHSVAGGYARNFLFPRGMAILATKGAMKQAEEIRQAGMRLRARERSNAEAQAEVIRQQRLLFEANAGENDRLYGSVTSGEVAERLATVCGFDIDRRRLQIHQPLRELGTFEVEMRLMPEVAPTFTVAVVREGEGWEDADARAAAKAEIEAQEAAAQKAADQAAKAAAKEAAREAEKEASEEPAEESSSTEE